MTIGIGSDHAGLEMKNKVREILQDMGHGVVDYGTGSKDSCDYSDFALKVARAVASGQVDRGVAVCWTGNGMTIAVNKIKGIRGTLCLNKDMAHFARAHNDSNVLTLSQKYINMDDLPDILKTWLEVEFEGGRHTRRLKIIADAENNE
jgi:ribose 5-phosphate isomerase B